MRDEARIERILQKLNKIWKEQPDTRFYQLINNLEVITVPPIPADTYYVEDTIFEMKLDDYIERFIDND